MGWFGGKSLSDKRRGEIALALLKKRMIKDGVCLTDDERNAALEEAQAMGLRTKDELVRFAKGRLISKKFDNLPKVDGVSEEEMGLFLEQLAEELVELSLNCKNG